MQLNNIWQKSFLRARAQLWLGMAATTETLHDDGHSDDDDDGDDDDDDDGDDDDDDGDGDGRQHRDSS